MRGSPLAHLSLLTPHSLRGFPTTEEQARVWCLPQQESISKYWQALQIQGS